MTLSTLLSTTAAPTPPGVVMPALTLVTAGEATVPTPEFALALASLAIAPAPASIRSPIAAGGKAVPVAAAALPLSTPATPDADAVVAQLPEFGGGDAEPAPADRDPTDDDASRDPALAWLIPPAPVVPAMPVSPAIAVPPPAVDATTSEARLPPSPSTPALSTTQPVTVDAGPIVVGEMAVGQAPGAATGTGTTPTLVPHDVQAAKVPTASTPGKPRVDVSVRAQAPRPAEATAHTTSLGIDLSAGVVPVAVSATPMTAVVAIEPPSGRGAALPTPTRVPVPAALDAATTVGPVTPDAPATAPGSAAVVAPAIVVAGPPRPALSADIAVAVSPPAIAPRSPATHEAAPPPLTAPTSPAATLEPRETPVATRERNLEPGVVTTTARAAEPATAAPVAALPAGIAMVRPAEAAATIAMPAAAPRVPLPFLSRLRPADTVRTPESAASAFFAAALQTTAPTPLAAPAVEAAAQVPIDLKQEFGIHRMIDRIEQLRDAADARDTRIRLVPDALGPVEVSVKRDGDAVRVHFVAEQPQARQLIADAQPRLTELAEARGIRIAQSTVDAGTDGHNQPRQPAPQQSATPAAPPRVRDTTTDDVADARLA